MNIKQLITEVESKIEAINDPADLPVPGDYEASAATLYFQAGVEAMREAAVRNLRVQGMNIHANQTFDLKV